jgi:Asp-tRNA(Asn)/Glu-tRNA(Gln) amidotransferase A subunit family amidase
MRSLSPLLPTRRNRIIGEPGFVAVWETYGRRLDDLFFRKGTPNVSRKTYRAPKLRKEWSSYRAQLRRAQTQTRRSYMGAETIRAQLNADWARFFERFDVLLSPVTLSAAYPVDETMIREDRRITVSGKQVDHNDQLFWAGYSTMPSLPVITIPIALGAAVSRACAGNEVRAVGRVEQAGCALSAARAGGRRVKGEGVVELGTCGVTALRLRMYAAYDLAGKENAPRS